MGPAPAQATTQNCHRIREGHSAQRIWGDLLAKAKPRPLIREGHQEHEEPWSLAPPRHHGNGAARTKGSSARQNRSLGVGRRQRRDDLGILHQAHGTSGRRDQLPLTIHR